MREFLKKGKWAVLVFVSAGLLFAGCMGTESSSSSDDDNALPIPVGENAFLVQVDPKEADAEITPLTQGGATASFDGHPVHMYTEGGACSWDGAKLTCDITLENLDPTHILGPARAVTTDCTSTNATLATADYPAPGENLMSDAGMCYAENGKDSGATPTVEGGSTFSIEGLPFAITFLGANGGSQTETWEFTNETALYQFIIWLTGGAVGDSEWYPENPYDGDPRYDFTNYTTHVIKFYGHDNLHPAYCMMGTKNKKGWQTGTPWCSSEVQDVKNGDTIWLNLMGEYADRIEQEHFDVWSVYDNNANGGPTGEDYEYYVENSIEVIYDPTVLSHPGLSPDRTPCVSNAGEYNCAQTPEHYQINAFAVDFSYVIYPDNRIVTAQSRAVNTFAFAYYHYVYTLTGQAKRLWSGGPGADLPKEVGEEGMMHWDDASLKMVPDGVDSDVDFWFSRVKMTVIGNSGDYTTVKLGQRANANWVFNHSNGTAAGGYTRDEDIRGLGATGWCYDDGGLGYPACNTSQTCADQVHIFFGSELGNCNLPPARGYGRADCAAGAGLCGGKQEWSTHIKVQ